MKDYIIDIPDSRLFFATNLILMLIFETLILTFYHKTKSMDSKIDLVAKLTLLAFTFTFLLKGINWTVIFFSDDTIRINLKDHFIDVLLTVGSRTIWISLCYFSLEIQPI